MDKELDLKEIDSNDLRDELALRGFYTNNLWHVDDVMNKYECNAEDAQDILDKVMRSAWIGEQVFESIDEVCAGHAHINEKNDE
jgi:hypothetical protein